MWLWCPVSPVGGGLQPWWLLRDWHGLSLWLRTAALPSGAVPSAFALCLAEELTGCSPCRVFQLMSAIQKGHVSGSRLAVLMKTAEENLRQRVVIPVDRSGGGL